MGKNEVEIIVTAEDKASGVLKGVGGTLQGIGRVATTAALGGVVAFAGGAALAGRAAIDMNSMLETSTLQFETLMGDSDKAAEHVASLFDFAASTPFETGPIIEASRIMQVFGGDALNTEENLTRIGDTAAAIGAPIEDIGFWVGRAYAAIQGGQPFGEAAQNLMQLGAVSPQVVAEMNALKEAGAGPDEIFAALTGHMDGFAGAMEKQAGTWEGLKSTVIDNLNMMAAQGLKPFFDLAKEGLSGLATWLNDPATQAGIQRMADGFATLIRQVGEFVTQHVIPFVSQHGELLRNLIIGIGVAFGTLAVIGTVIGWIGGLISAVTAIGGAITAAIPIVTAIVGVLGGPLTLVIGAVVAVIALLRAAWVNNWGDIQGKTAAAIAFIQSIIQNALAAIQAFWQAHGTAIVATATQIWDLIRGVIDGAVQSIQLIVAAFTALFQGDWESFGQLILQIWQNAWNTAVNFLSGLWNMVSPWLTSLWQSVSGWFTGQDWAGLGRSIVQGIINGLRAMGDALSGALQSIVDAAIGRIKALLGISSPSKVTTYFGRMTGQGLVDGILSQVGAVGGAVDTMLRAAGFQSGRGGLSGTFGIAGRISGGAAGQLSTAGSSRSVVVNIDARGAAKGVDRDLREMVRDVMREYGLRADARVRTGG